MEMNMKLLSRCFLAVLCVASVSACSDDEGEPTPEYDVISFEPSEHMVDVNGELVTLGDVEVVGGDAAATHHHVYWGKPYVDVYGQLGQYGDTYLDLPLFSTADENIWFGSYYTDSGSYKWDTWAGFVLSQNYNTTATSHDYANQFAVYAGSGANSSSTFAVSYSSSMSGYTYTTPTIEFAVKPRTVAYLYMAPSTIPDSYHNSDPIPVYDHTFSFRTT